MEEKTVFVIAIILFSSFILVILALSAGLFLSTFRNIKATIKVTHQAWNHVDLAEVRYQNCYYMSLLWR